MGSKGKRGGGREGGGWKGERGEGENKRKKEGRIEAKGGQEGGCEKI